MKKIVYLSTVTPVYRGADTLSKLVEEIDKIRQKLIDSSSPLQILESIFVDDGSKDNSISVLNELCHQYDWIRIVQLSRNFGQHPATMAGILYSGGDWIVTLDEDLQHNPKFFIDLLRHAILQKKDVVYAFPKYAVHESIFRDFASRGYKYILSKLTGNPDIRRFNSFRMMRASIARAAAAVAGHQTYFDLAVGWFTSYIGVINLPLKDYRYIKEGRSGYSFHALLSHARRMIQSSEVKVLRFGALVGLIAMLFTTAAALYVVILKIVSPDAIVVQGWASVMVAVLFFGGLNAFLIGLTLDHLSLMLMQSHGKPTYFEIDRRSDLILLNYFQQKESE